MFSVPFSHIYFSWIWILKGVLLLCAHWKLDGFLLNWRAFIKKKDSKCWLQLSLYGLCLIHVSFLSELLGFFCSVEQKLLMIWYLMIFNVIFLYIYIGLCSIFLKQCNITLPMTVLCLAAWDHLFHWRIPVSVFEDS